MVERLKEAIEKARQQRGEPKASSSGVSPGEVVPVASGADTAWNALPMMPMDVEALQRRGIVTLKKTDASHIPFDILRTRLLTVCRENQWSKIIITSPHRACGKTFVTANLAFSLARRMNSKTIVFDFDFAHPSLWKILDVRPELSLPTAIRTGRSPDSVLMRISDSVAMALSTERVSNSSELIQSTRAAALIDAVAKTYCPELMIFDMPPILVSDDVLGFLSPDSAVLVVAGAGRTKASDLREVERLLGPSANFIGVVLNGVEDDSPDGYYPYPDGENVAD